MAITVVIVVYNFDVSLVRAIELGKKFSCVKQTIILDNSVNENIIAGNEAYCGLNGLVYVKNDGNIGLSKAYNVAIRMVNDEDAIAIFDQDTAIDGYDLNVALPYLSTYDVVLPTVYSKGRILSPSSLKRDKVVPYGRELFITGINSGMIIKKSVFDKVGYYNEKMFLDYIDHEFMRRCNENCIRILALETISLNQGFSDDEQHSLSADLTRYKIFIKDFKVFCKSKKYFYFKSLKRAIKLSLKHKSFAFIKEWKKNK